MAKATTRNPVAAPETEKPAIAVVKPKNPLDALKMVSKAATKPAKKKEKERPELELDEEQSSVFNEWRAAKELLKLFKDKEETDNALVKDILFALYAELLWQFGVLENPTVKTEVGGKPYNSAIYAVKEKYKVKMPEVGEDQEPADALVDLLVDLGVEKPDAVRLVEKEVDFTPNSGLRSFSELAVGSWRGNTFTPSTEEEKAVSTKIMEFVINNLTPEEQAVCLVSSVQTKVQKGFLDRAKSYAHSVEQLAAILSVIEPEQALTSKLFAATEDLPGKQRVLLEVAEKVLGEESST